MVSLRARLRAVARAGLIGLGAFVVGVREAHAEEPASWQSRGTLDLGAGLAVRDNRGAVGQTDGTAVAAAYAFDLGVRATHGPHRLALSLRSSEGLSFAPVAGVAVKMIDDLRLEVGYELGLSRWVLPFVEASFEAPLFSAEEVRASPQSFVIVHADGSRERSFAKRLHLTDPLRPAAIRESTGARFRPVDRTWFALSVDAGLGAAELVAGGQRALADVGGTTTVEAIETESSSAVGPELAVRTSGRLDDRRLLYALAARARIPFASTNTRVAKSLGAAARTDVEVQATVSLELVPWLTLDYGLALLRRPLLVERVELRNTLVLSARPTGTGLVF